MWAGYAIRSYGFTYPTRNIKFFDRGGHSQFDVRFELRIWLRGYSRFVIRVIASRYELRRWDKPRHKAIQTCKNSLIGVSSDKENDKSYYCRKYCDCSWRQRSFAKEWSATENWREALLRVQARLIASSSAIDNRREELSQFQSRLNMAEVTYCVLKSDWKTEETTYCKFKHDLHWTSWLTGGSSAIWIWKNALLQVRARSKQWREGQLQVQARLRLDKSICWSVKRNWKYKRGPIASSSTDENGKWSVDLLR